MLTETMVVPAVGEIETRQFHNDPTVKEIAAALLEFRQAWPQTWVDQVIAGSNNHSSLQTALVLEKIVLHSVLSNLWTGIMAVIPEDREEAAAIQKSRVFDQTKNGWTQVISAVSEADALKQSKKPIQTHRLPRYKNLIREVILPRVSGKQQTVLDAGSALGAGSHLAGELGWSVKEWLALDIVDSRQDLPWILSCSFRFREIFQPDFLPNLQKYLALPAYTTWLVGDMQKLPLDNDSVDVYMAMFSYYQLLGMDQAFEEAGRVAKPGGLIFITDYFAKGIDKLALPGDGSQIATKVWQKDRKENVKLVDTQVWRDTDLNK